MELKGAILNISSGQMLLYNNTFDKIALAILIQTVTQLNHISTSLPRMNTSKKQKERSIQSRKAHD